MNNSLYSISADFRTICDALEENGGELTPEIEEALTLVENNFLVKAENYIEAIALYQAKAEAVAERIAVFQRIKKTAENIEKRMKERLLQAMMVMDKDTVEVGLRKLSIRSSQAVNITDEVRIPNQYIKVETKVDKDALRRDLKAGLVVEGAELVTNKSLQIR